MPEFQYIGGELDLFSVAINWKAYWANEIREYLQGETIEVGAGIGANTEFLCCHGRGKWICLEPDKRLLDTLRSRALNYCPGRDLQFLCGTLTDLPAGELYDSIIYIDVLEHIEDDVAEVRRAAERLKPGGRLIVLSPAHQFLFSPFDAAIGHYRRYNKATLRRVQPDAMVEEKMFYLDSAGMLLSAANRMLLKQSSPTKEQLSVWDKYIVPISRRVDPLFGKRLGKTIIGIWRKRAA